MKPILIAHRGDKKVYKQDVFKAFDSAFSNGVDGIEFDIQVNKKGQVVIVHDYLYDQGDKNLPLLSQVIEAYKNKGRLEIEIKTYEKESVEIIVNEIKKFKIPNYEVTSAEVPVIDYVEKLIPQAERGLIMKNCLFEKWMTKEHIIRMLLGYLKFTKATVLHLDLLKYNSKLIQELKKGKIKSHTLIENQSEQAVKRAISDNIDICSITNMDIVKLFKENISTA